MLKRKNDYRFGEWEKCPMGTFNENNKIECYYFGIIEIKDCNECKRR